MWISRRFSTILRHDDLPAVLFEHSTPTHRALKGVEPALFENKRTNLALAAKHIDGVLIQPGEIFSFWHLVGPPVASRGFLEGLMIANGRPVGGVGGGLCQFSNGLHWLVLHSGLQVIERHRHSLDLFPDAGRCVPFGTGATIFFNYKDFRVKNVTEITYQVRASLTETDLKLRLLASEREPVQYRIQETDHAFERRADGLYRCNTIVQERIDTVHDRVSSQVLFRNECKCHYDLAEVG